MRIALIALILAAILATCACSQQIWQEQRITNTPWGEAGPVLSGNTICYNDWRNGYGDIYVWDEAHGSRMLIGGDGIGRAVLGMSGETHVTGRYFNNQYAIYVWDALNGDKPIDTTLGDQMSASIFADTVVCENWESGRPQVYMWDPANGNRPLFASSTWQEDPKVFGSRVACCRLEEAGTALVYGVVRGSIHSAMG